MGKKKLLKSSAALLMSALVVSSGTAVLTVNAAENTAPESVAPGVSYEIVISKFDIHSTGINIQAGDPVCIDIDVENALKEYDSYNSAYVKIIDERGIPVTTLQYDDRPLYWYPTKGGKYSAEFFICDYFGATAQETKEFEVVDHMGVELNVLSDYAGWQIPGDAITLVADAAGGREMLEYKFTCTYTPENGQPTTTTLRDYDPLNSIDYTLADEGKYNFTVTVRDGYGMTVSSSKEVSAYNPGFIYCDATPTDIVMGESVTFSTWLTNNQRGFTVRYDITGNGKTTTINHDDLTTKATWKPNKAGTYTVKATIVKDGVDGKSKTLTINVAESKLSVMVEASKTTDYVPTGKPVSIKLSATGGVGKYTFGASCVWENTPMNDLVKISDTEYILTPSEDGPYTITASVMDELGNRSSRSLQISTFSPRIVNFYADIDNAKVGDTVKFTTKFVGRSVSFKYTVTKGTAVTTLDSTGKTATWVPTEEGTYTITVTEYCYGVEEDSKSITYTVAPAPVTNNTATIYYKGFKAPKIQYQVNSEEWSEPVAITKVKGIDGVTHKYTINMGTGTEATVRFVNGSGALDDLGGQNYTFTKGVYIFSDGTINSFKNRKAMTNNTFKADIKLESANVPLGNKFFVNCTAEGGTGNYTYSFSYRSADSSSWTTVSNKNNDSNVKILIKNEGKYVICAKVKDGSGTIIKKYFAVNVYGKAKLVANLSAEKIKIGEKITVYCAGAEGSGSYQYAVFYKKKVSTNDYSTVQNYSKNAKIEVEPKGATEYDILVKVKDTKTGYVDKINFSAIVVR